MIEFKISAPGRLSLFGEHVINYDKSSLTASINLRTTLTFTELPHVCPEDIIQVEFLQIGLFLSIPLRQFLDFYRNCTINEYDNEYNNLHDQVLQFTSNHCSFRTEHQRAIAQASIYLLVYISCRENIDIKSFCVRLFTQLIIGRKIVCLASSTVCFAACFLRWSNLQKGAIDDFDSSDLNKIHSYAVRCKRISCESGMIDVAACTYGSIIEHRIGEILRIIPFFEMLTVTILLVDSGQTQNLEAQTQQVTELVNTYPKFARSVFNNFYCVTSVASNVFQKLGPIYANDEFGSETKRLTIMMQHNLLVSSKSYYANFI